MRPVGAALEFDAAIHVFRVFTEDHQVDFVGPLIGCLDTLEVPDRPNAGVQIELNSQVNVDAAKAAADRRRQRPFEAKTVVFECRQRVVGQVQSALFVFAQGATCSSLTWGSTFRGPRRRRARQPFNAALAAVDLLHGSIEDAGRRRW